MYSVINKKEILFLCLLILSLFPHSAIAKKCLYISSYHVGYEWSDGIEKGLRNTLEGKCEVQQFNMDTKRHKDETYKKQIALKAKQLIETWQPDIVIVSDDNAARYIIQPYYKDHRIPFVFCGINWHVNTYGFPYSNTTGMVEVAPISALFEKVSQIRGKANTGFYLGADTLTEKKNLSRFQQEATDSGIKLLKGLAKNMAQWLNYYKQAQQYDFVIIGSNSGINDWDPAIIQKTIVQVTDKLSVTNHHWMMPYSILGLTKIPEEQGIWAAQAALYILDGTSPADIPIISNRKWDLWINEKNLSYSEIKMPHSLLKKAKKIGD